MRLRRIAKWSGWGKRWRNWLIAIHPFLTLKPMFSRYPEHRAWSLYWLLFEVAKTA